ncbi:response regulator [Deinococcus aquatilis]|jgi:two-component system OmpR family response regulator|uniref:response regulator n=1 Tax=Deinococcus aquatilis TaxID=519440 RepID=UPI0003796084|nr:response regulator [Deinococcus aquatilis]
MTDPDEEGAGLHLLVVDDEAQILELLDLTLTMSGFLVTTARSGPDALALAQSQPFDVIVLDILMTPWDGFETVRQLHAALGARLPPVVFLSGLNRAAQVPDLGDALIAAYLVKPFRPSQLVEVIGQVARAARDHRSD